MNMNQLSKMAKTHIFMEYTRPILDFKALFSDGTSEYRMPNEPEKNEKVTLRFRTGRGNVDVVNIVIDGIKYAMKKELTDKLFDYYSYVLQLEEEAVAYYFEIISGKVVCYYHRRGVSKDIQPQYDFVIMPGFHTPDWAKGAVIYQIYVDRFYNGNPDNDVLDREYSYIGEHVTKVEDWGKYPAAMGVREFYGGDLQGVIQKLDYLTDLGIDAIYFNPLFVSPSNHKYDIQDYDYIDPHFGVIVTEEGMVLEEGNLENKDASLYISRVTSKENLEASNELFIQLVEEAHKRGIKVILDGVFNHCGSFNKWLDRERIYENQEGYEKGAYIDFNSPYRSFFRFRGGQWPYNERYDGWWGHDTLPKLNYEESPKLFEYIMNIARKWVSPPYNADGWRLDVAADLGQSSEYNHLFWKEFRRNVKEANPDAIILAEHYGNSSSWLKGDEWDTVMNYDAFMEPITWFLTGVEKHSDEFRGEQLNNSDNFIASMEHHMANMNNQSLEVAMNELSNHDHSRFLTRTNHMQGRTGNIGPKAAEENINKGIFREAVVMQMTWPGAPTIYYGDEAGVCGWTDPDNRRTYPWGEEDKELIEFHKELIRIHNRYKVLKTGSVKFLGNQLGYLSYGRFNQEEQLIVAVNNNRTSITVDIPVWEIGILDGNKVEEIFRSDEYGYSMNQILYSVKNGEITLTLEPFEAIILKNTKKNEKN